MRKNQIWKKEKGKHFLCHDFILAALMKPQEAAYQLRIPHHKNTKYHQIKVEEKIGCEQKHPFSTHSVRCILGQYLVGCKYEQEKVSGEIDE